MSDNKKFHKKKNHQKSQDSKSGRSANRSFNGSKLNPKMVWSNFIDYLATKVGKEFAIAGGIIRDGKISNPTIPEHVTVESFVEKATREEEIRQVAQGIPPEDVEVEFEPSTYDEVMALYYDQREDFASMVAGLSAADKLRLSDILKTAYNEDVKIYRKNLNDLRDYLPRIFNAILDEVGPESRNLLKSHQSVNWPEIERKQDPAALIRALKISHTLEINGSKAANRRKAREGYEKLQMSDYESPEEFRIKFVDHVSTVEQLDDRGIEQDIQAADFLAKLSPAYSGLLELISWDDYTGKNPYPVSLAEAFSLVLAYKRPLSKPQKASGTVFSATGDSGSDANSAGGKSRTGGGSSKQQQKKSQKSGDSHSSGKQSNHKHSAESSDKSSDGKKSGKNKYVKCHFCDGEHYATECQFRELAREAVKVRREDKDSDVANWVNGSIHMVESLQYEIDEDLNQSICYSKKVINDEDWSHSYEVALDGCADVSGTNNPLLLTEIKNMKGSIGGIDKSQPRLVTNGMGKFLNEFQFFVSDKFRKSIWSEGAILEAGWKITIDQSNNDKIVTAPCGKQYVFKFRNRRWLRDFSDEVAHNILMVGDQVETELQNEQLYSKREVEMARLAGILLRRLGFPSVDVFVKMIERGVVNNCPVSVDDVLRCLKISDRSLISYLKGKSVQRPVVFEKPAKVPRLIDKNQALYMDIMFIAQIAFLISISKPMHLITATALGKSSGQRTSVTLREAIKQHINVYSKYGFKISEIHSDPETGMLSQQQWLASIGINYISNPGDVKVGIVENCIRRIKNTARCLLHSIPYHLSYVLLVWLVCYSVYCMNFHVSKMGREGLCARQELTGVRPDMKRDFRIGFGDYAQVPHKPAGNGLEAKTVGAIAVLPMGNPTGSVKFISLLTAKVITRNQFKILPMPNNVVNFMNEWAREKDGLPEDIVNNWGKFLEIQDEDDEGLEVDSVLHQMLQRYKVPMVNIDQPRVPVAPVTTTNFLETDPGASSSGPPAPVTDTQQVEDTAAVGHSSGVTESGVTDTRSVQPAETRESFFDSSQHTISYTQFTALSDTEEYGQIFSSYGGPCIFQMTLNQSKVAYGEKAEEAAVKEIMQLHLKPMWIGVPPKIAKQIPNHLKIQSKLFMKEKLNTNRQLEKIKGRLVSRGDQVPEELKEYIDSPTVSAEAVFLLLSIFAVEEREWSSYDVPAAYTNAVRNPNSSPIFMVLNKDVTDIIVKNDPIFSMFVNEKGSSLVKIIRAAYGLSDSSGLWFLEVSKFLKSIGFAENPVMPCVFNKLVDGHQATILLYVDDMLISHKSINVVKSIMDALDVKYGKGTRSEGQVIEFLGMRIEKEPGGSVLVSMPKHIDELLEQWKVNKFSEFPAAHNLFEVDEQSPRLSEILAAKFRSGVASALFIAKRAPRPDVLLPVNYLATRVTKSTESDLQKFLKTLKYLYGTKRLAMRLAVGNDKTLTLYVDASYGVHDKGQSHTGSVLKYGNATIQVKSSKQKIVAKSSCEAELIGASDEAGQLLHHAEFLVHQGYEEFVEKPGVLFQDNQASMKLEENGKSSSNRTKHISIRTFWIKDQVKSGKIKIVYKPTTEMLADMLTKPLQGEQFYKFRKQLMNER